ncbi:hypothetical protein, partial [Paenibacillus xylanexedens]|uniref:hypothetical protein n=1 Tax=Paenibacillus xylanexedens TaxID=528191 RepID=UPI003F7A4F3C
EGVLKKYDIEGKMVMELWSREEVKGMVEMKLGGGVIWKEWVGDEVGEGRVGMMGVSEVEVSDWVGVN